MIMQKVSLNKDQQLLIDSFFKIKTKKNLNIFIEDLFSPEETLDLAQRLKIAKLILDGKTYEEIAAEIPVSTSTISKIGQVIKFGKGGLQIACKSNTKVKKEKLGGGEKSNVG